MCFLLVRKKIWKIEKFNALKASRPEVVADAEDTMEFAVEEAASKSSIFFKKIPQIRKLWSPNRISNLEFWFI
jgi:hypothetical protein